MGRSALAFTRSVNLINYMSVYLYIVPTGLVWSNEARLRRQTMCKYWIVLYVFVKKGITHATYVWELMVIIAFCLTMPRLCLICNLLLILTSNDHLAP